MKKVLLGILMTLTLTFGMGSYAYAQSTGPAKDAACNGVSSQTLGNCNTGGADLTKLVGGVLNAMSVIAGIVAVVMVIISGFRYITSGGDSNAVSGAKKTLIYAVVGVIVVALSQIIVRFVLANTE